MDGDGRYLSPTLLRSKWQPITRRIARDATFPRSRRIGSTSKVIRFSPQSDSVQKAVSQNCLKGDGRMRKSLLVVILGLGVAAASSLSRYSNRVAADTSQTAAVFDSEGKLKLPVGYRRWVFIGAPLSPNALNNGKASFPEYHHVYVEEKNLDVYLKTGSFPEGTVFVKELTRVLNPTFPDGSRTEPSGRGYFNGEFNGMDVTVKDSKRFAATNGWGFFNFGHHPLPYSSWAKEASAAECAGCHMSFVAKTDMTWGQFYPILRDGDKTK